MERCTLCGGRLVKGRCTECGLDNTKNDKKYHLNVHNEKVTMFHRGKCEDNLNRDNDKEQKLQKAGQKTDKERLWKDESGEKDRKGNGTVKSAGSQGKERKAQSAKKLKERRQTGTVKKEGGVGRLVLWLIILVVAGDILAGVIGAWMEEMPEFLEENVSSFLEEIGVEHDGAEDSSGASAQQRPMQELWDTSASDYFEAELTPGIYNIGYELPAGRYQIYCEKGTAWINWWNTEDEYSNDLYLLSMENQEYYIEEYGACDYFELSEVLDLREGAVIYVEDCEESITIAGQSAGERKEHKPQGLYEEIDLENDMTAGEDFPAGVYDITFVCDEEEYASAFLSIKDAENGGTYFASVDTEYPVFYRFPFRKGSAVTLESYGAEVAVRLIPSY